MGLPRCGMLMLASLPRSTASQEKVCCCAIQVRLSDFWKLEALRVWAVAIEHPHSRQAELLTSGSTRRQRASERQMEGVEQLPWPPQATLQACPHLPEHTRMRTLSSLSSLPSVMRLTIAKTCAC